ncbi:MAG: FemAB family XrtA/PEP-CTERM system-associated protein [Rubripirellula sp.]
MSSITTEVTPDQSMKEAAWSDDQSASPRLAAHHDAWVKSICEGLKHSSYLITAKEEGEVVGYLPLVFVKGPIFGKFLVSLPYVNTGGVWARDADAASRLVDRACDLADELKVRYLELRHEQSVDHPRFNFERTDKVHMRLALPATDEALNKSFKSKLRSQVKKSGTHGHEVCWGEKELLSQFHEVFSINMRDLGTPVFSRGLFGSIVEQFAGQAEFCVLQNSGQPIAAALLVHSGGKTEVPSASCLRDWNHTAANMFMYRQLLRRAIERGSTTFDFGRSSEGSGTYKFKAQWGAVPNPATWQYYVREGSVDAMRPDSEGNQRLIKIWQKLPVGLTRVIGPSIVRGIP